MAIKFFNFCILERKRRCGRAETHRKRETRRRGGRTKAQNRSGKRAETFGKETKRRGIATKKKRSGT